MKDKIKIIAIISIVLFALCFAVIPKSYAENLGLTATHHIDPITGLSELLPQLVDATQDSAKGAVICVQKGGALRFTKDYSSNFDSVKNSNIMNPFTVHYGSEHCDQGDINIHNTGNGNFMAAANNSFHSITGLIYNIVGGSVPASCLPKRSTAEVWKNYGTDDDFTISSYSTDHLICESNKFAETPNYTEKKLPPETNNYKSYLLSAGSWTFSSPAHGATANGHTLKQGNYQQTVSDTANAQLIQDAVWCSDLNKGTIVSTPQQAVDLLNEAKAYEAMASQLTNYQPNFLTTSPKVIVNQSSKTYIIGPYKISYPDDRRFSYIQDMYVVDSKGNKVNTTIIVSDNSKKNNGGYPKTGEDFFLQFSANDVDNPSTVGVKVDFAYLKSTTASYSIYEGKGDICEYVGYYDLKQTTHQVNDGQHAVETCNIATFTPHIEKVKVGSYDPQILIKVAATISTTEEGKEGTISRIWAEKSITTSDNLKVYLGIELGGAVWEDSNGGKESVANGIMDGSEKRIPNVEVKLYKNGQSSPIKTAKTDSKGEYKFTELSAMEKYYVTFTYNGQYYEPTTYAPSSTWGSATWNTNSNATDNASERAALNQKFATIGASPNNYGGGAVYTRTELQSSGTIDEFGNLNSEGGTGAQFVKDCQITATTGNGSGGIDLYPYKNEFTIDSAPVANSLVPNYAGLYPAAYHINLGLHPRQEADLAINKDIEKVTLEINGQKQEYGYESRGEDGNWDISVRLSDAYYNTNYSREIYPSDYFYKVSQYGNEQQQIDLGKSKSDELEVYVTYKIMVRNQSLSIQMKINEIVDYYDEDYEYVEERSYMQLARGSGRTAVGATTNSTCGSSTNLSGYNKIYIHGLNGTYLSAGQTAYVYLTFKVKKDSNAGELWLKLDEDYKTAAEKGVGKENIVEVNGYSTQYAPGTQVPNIGNVGGSPAGIVDRDSKPGNINPSDVPKDGPINYQNFEDDTDKAPNLRLKLYRDDSANRVISGVVWEDERTPALGATATGDGIKQENENRINGVTVQLVEIMANGKEFVWKTFENGSGMVASTQPVINFENIVADYKFPEKHDGAYAFKSFIPGKYVVRFIYGDTENTVLTKDVNTGVNKVLGKSGQNEKSYNGQDYKSTIYQKDIPQNSTYTWRANSSWSLGQEKVGAILKQISTFKADASNNETGTYLYDNNASNTKDNVSDAKDIESRRNEVVDYSDNDVTNHIAEVLTSFRELPEYVGKSYNKEQLQALINELMEKTQMRAETGVMVMEIEYNTTKTENQLVNNKASYSINNVDLGLEERPKAQLVIDKTVTNVKLTLADGSILFDASDKATNVLWKRHQAYKEGYNAKNQMDPSIFGSLVNIRNQNASKVGLIQLTLDEELMHGATIQISYKVTVKNIGEVDYKENKFYYTGQVGDTNNVVKTRANQVIDYVANNLQFYENDNSNWNVISLQELNSQKLINQNLESQAEKYNTIIITDKLNEELVPTLYKNKINNSAKDTTDSIPLVLRQVITSENNTDDLSYHNIVEIVKTSNTAGRRNEFSVVGNQDPSKDPQELDSDKAEVVKILPPFGNAGIYTITAIIVIVVAGIVVGGVIFIKKKVLNS